jgi:hypothetical protein
MSNVGTMPHSITCGMTHAHNPLQSIKKMLLQTALLTLPLASIAASSLAPLEGTELAATFVDGRIYVDMPVPDHGAALHLFTDTGGGSLLLSKEAAVKLRLPLRPDTDKDDLMELGPDIQIGEIAESVAHTWRGIPPHAQFTVVPKIAPMGWAVFGDGILGNGWFANHVWTLDYPNHRLILRPAAWHPTSEARPLDISFKSDATGNRLMNLPRITILIGGEQIPVLFDSGATTMLTPAALQVLADDKPALRATSMISHSVFERWHARFPEWQVVDDAQLGTHSRMILVPSVEITAVKSAPVWFTERSDDAFAKFMSPMMSAEVKGSLGGNAMGALIVTIDYPNSRAWVQVR